MPLARRALLTAFAAGSAGAAAVACTSAGATSAAAADDAPAKAPSSRAATAARRLLPRHWRQITFRTTSERDTFRVSGRTGRITVSGDTPATQLTGFNWYLLHIAYDNLSLLTVWGTRAGADAGLRDYANREWAGLVGGLYRLRWSTYFTESRTALSESRAPKEVDWFALEDRWIRDPGRLATRPTGDAYEIATQVRDRLTALA